MLTLAYDVRWDVIQHLHSRLRDLPPGTESAEIAEHALTLALHPGRRAKDSPLLLHDLWRNAQHSIRRTRARSAALVERVVASGADSPAAIDHVTPEDLCVARDLVARLRTVVAQIGPGPIRCLDGLL